MGARGTDGLRLPAGGVNSGCLGVPRKKTRRQKRPHACVFVRRACLAEKTGGAGSFPSNPAEEGVRAPGAPSSHR